MNLHPKYFKRLRQVLIFGSVLAMVIWVGSFGWVAWNQQRIAEWVNSGSDWVEWEDRKGALAPLSKLLREKLGITMLDQLVAVHFENREVTPANLKRLQRLPHLQYARFNGMTLEAEHMQVLSRLDPIALDLSRSDFEAQDLKYIGQIQQLEELYLGNTSVTGESLAYFASLRLRVLELHETAVSDADLVHLRPHAETLDLLFVGEGVTNAGIPELLACHNLRILHFMGSPITNEGITRLEEGLPRLKGLGLHYTYVSGDKIDELEKKGYRVVASF